MTEVKSVIYHLCKLFNGLFSSEIIKPEHFRYSKFDETSDEVVPALWKLLHNLCCSTTQKKMRCDSADIVSCVKLAFARMRYSCLSLFNLPTNMKVGSRELLLALAWLLTTDRLQQLIHEFVSKSLLQHEYPSYSAGEELGAFESINLKSEEDIINFINWVSGRVKTNMAYIRNLSRELITHTSRESVMEEEERQK
ncbi:tubulin epsilon and delta complex protein 1 isoform X4 [Nilaparvata lugens]|uniref:tubulin epsilon and delta complex protein 1 isoform X4 n=1 Tax=Nilaparvata lugens TaxID=108931 RepID=UPI000B999824|nr:tubulin epsilon and delta complex protein 1 isoform X4 [Nilaparvata lugens]